MNDRLAIDCTTNESAPVTINPLEASHGVAVDALGFKKYHATKLAKRFLLRPFLERRKKR